MPVTPTGPDLSRYRREELLRDGYRVLLRPIEKSDVPLWLAFISRLSTNTKYLRFHNIPKEMTEEDAIRYCTVDYHNSFAYVAEIGKGTDRKIIAITRYYRNTVTACLFHIHDLCLLYGESNMIYAVLQITGDMKAVILKGLHHLSILAEDIGFKD